VAVLLFLSSWLGVISGLSAQEDSASHDSTITLTKNVEVYSFEDLTFTVENYTVAPGESIEGVLRKEGLWPEGPDGAPGSPQAMKLLRLVSVLNPVVANLDQINEGQTLYLPRLEAPSPAALDEIPVVEDPGSHVVVTYNLDSPEQLPARVVVKRQDPESLPPELQKPPEPLPEGTFSLNLGAEAPADPPKAASAASAAAPPRRVPGETPAASAGADPAPAKEGSRRERSRRAAGTRPVLNEGPVSVGADGVRYRTVKIRRGDTLERLLRREGLDPGRIYRDYIKLTVGLNPGIKNPNLIIAGREVNIPVREDQVLSAEETRSPERDPRTYPSTVSDAGGFGQAEGLTARNQAAPGGSPPAPGKAPSAQAGGKNASQGKFRVDTKRLPAAPLPTADSKNAQTVLAVVFTRLGETVTTSGRLFLPLDEPPHYDYDMSAVPVVELKNGRRVILDLRNSLSADFIQRFRARYPGYMVFQPRKGEPLSAALDELFKLCGYYKVYAKDKSFEGGRDLKLKISADWLVWPTSEDWNKGQPVVINLAPSQDSGTPLPWVKFLADHNISVVDLYKGELLAGSRAGATPVNNFTVIEVDGDNPSAFAAALIKSFGFSPRIGVAVDLSLGRVATGGASFGVGLSPAVFWEDGKNRNILEYGDFSTEELNALRQNGFRVISSARDAQSVLKSILAASDIKLGGPLVLNGDSPGGPSISLVIAGESFSFNDRSYLFTPVRLPKNMTGLDPNQTVVVLRYQPQGAPAGASPPSGQAPAAPPADGGTPPEGSEENLLPENSSQEGVTGVDID
jgi:hypothetical protein